MRKKIVLLHNINNRAILRGCWRYRSYSLSQISCCFCVEKYVSAIDRDRTVTSQLCSLSRKCRFLRFITSNRHSRVRSECKTLNESREVTFRFHKACGKRLGCISLPLIVVSTPFQNSNCAMGNDAIHGHTMYRPMSGVRAPSYGGREILSMIYSSMLSSL